MDSKGRLFDPVFFQAGGIGCAECGHLITISDEGDKKPVLTFAWEPTEEDYTVTIVHTGCMQAYFLHYRENITKVWNV